VDVGLCFTGDVDRGEGHSGSREGPEREREEGDTCRQAFRK
jgi:hypothetical protein